MDEKTVSIFVFNTACVLLLGWGLSKFQRRMLARRLPDDVQKLRPGRWILFMSMLSFWMGLLFLMTYIFSKSGLRPVADKDQWVMAVATLLFFLFAAKVVQAYFCLLGISPKGLAWWTPGRGKQEALRARWSEIKRVRAGALSGRFHILTKGGASFSNYFYGQETGALLDAFDQHLPKSALGAKTKSVFEKLRARIVRYAPKK